MPKRLGLLVFLALFKYCRASSSTEMDQAVLIPAEKGELEARPSAIRVVLSDVDGTLVHYPDDLASVIRYEDAGNAIVRLPPSATGLQAVISSKTLRQCAALRRLGVKLVLVSGMRTRTLWSRLPYLPRADAYCSEAGGRIFYPTKPGSGFLQIIPVPYDGAEKEDLEPFSIEEDRNWRRIMEQESAAGKDGYIGNDGATMEKDPIPIAERSGALWEFARDLMELGFVLDTRGYACCFRVTRNQQASDSDGPFEALVAGAIAHPPTLGTSTNLGSVDFYPISSGKKNCGQYLAEKFVKSAGALSRHCVCICDDDNDLEMAMACQHAYIPSISSTSMTETIHTHPEQFTETFQKGVQGTLATEYALSLIIEACKPK